VFVRSEAQLARGQAALEASGMSFTVIGPRMETTHGRASLAAR
jgi:hypothetical protein